VTAPPVPAFNAPGQVLLVALTGSYAYGLQRPESDVDFRGVYACSARDMLSLRPPPETVDRQHPDVTLHELRKFCRLAAAANPTVLEVLWAPMVLRTPAGDALVHHRRMFLSRRARQTYGGYARQQLIKAQRGSGGSRGVEHFKREKFLVHLLRLMDAGLHLLEHGEVMVRVPDPDGLRARAAAPLDEIAAHVAVMERAMDEALGSSPLPEHPDLDAVDDVMAAIRDQWAGRP
jgi:predicted nucleotidyltransferase